MSPFLMVPSVIFSDKASGQSTERPQLQAMLTYLREGDIVVVTELDRLGRNNKELTELMNQIQLKGATLEAASHPAQANATNVMTGSLGSVHKAMLPQATAMTAQTAAVAFAFLRASS